MAHTRVVGIVLPQEKARKHVTPALTAAAERAGITLLQLDEHTPLDQQGHIDVLLHKIRRPEWEEQLVAYTHAHPHVRIFDLPSAIHPLCNRETMLEHLDGAEWILEAPPHAAHAERGAFTCSTPRHAILEGEECLAGAEASLTSQGLQYPLVLKPTWADGRAGAHALAVVSSGRGLEHLLRNGKVLGMAFPALAQPYIDHGGCLFKVYVLGDRHRMVTRASLAIREDAVPGERGCDPGRDGNGDAAAGMQLCPPRGCIAMPDCGVQMLSRVSAYPHSQAWGRSDLAPQGHGVPVPPDWVWGDLAQRLRRRLHVNLFNFDVIVPRSGKNGRGGEPTRLYLIDINYFPGYEKLADYEDLMIGFLTDTLQATAPSQEAMAAH